MLILGIDTATPWESVSVVSGGVVLSERGVFLERDHCASLLRVLAEALSASNVSLSDLEGIAVSVGPGSYTGLRVGLSTAKGLAYSAGKPLVGVSTLEAVAQVGFGVDRDTNLVCPMIDARKGEVFAALFERNGKGCERVTSDLLVDPRLLLLRTDIQEKGCLFLGDGVEVHRRVIESALGNKAKMLSGESLLSSGKAVALLGEQKLSSGIHNEDRKSVV